MAAQHDLHATLRAQEQAGWSLHKHPGQTEVLDGRVPAGHTAMAPPSSARCRARYGAVRLAGYGHIAAAPTSFGMAAVVSRAPPSRPTLAPGHWRCRTDHLALHSQELTASWSHRLRPRASLAALQGGQAGNPRKSNNHLHTLGLNTRQFLSGLRHRAAL